MLLFEKAVGARGRLFNNPTTGPFLSVTPLGLSPMPDCPKDQPGLAP